MTAMHRRTGENSSRGARRRIAAVPELREMSPTPGHAFQTPTSPSPRAAYIDRIRRDRFLSIAAQAVGSHLVRSVRQNAGGDLDIEAAAGHHAQRLAGPDDLL